MKTYTHVVITGMTVIGLISPLCGEALTMATATESQSTQTLTTVEIGNNTQIPLYNARIKLKAGDTWTNLGNVVPGQNTLYKKDHSGKVKFNIEMNNDPKFKELLSKEYKADIPALNLYSAAQTMGFLPVSSKLAYDQWSISCANMGKSKQGRQL